MQTFLTSLTFLLVVGCSLDAQQPKWVVLPGNQAELVARLCSRSELPKVERSWEPTITDVAAVEKKLSEVPKLQRKSIDSGIPIKDPRIYHRQYVGVVVAGRKLIYVNAFCDKSPPSNWREKLVNDCDGGCNWGVLYDPATREFSSLGMNGIG